MEVNKTKEDMKSLQNDLTHADKEISVRLKQAGGYFGIREFYGSDF